MPIGCIATAGSPAEPSRWPRAACDGRESALTIRREHGARGTDDMMVLFRRGAVGASAVRRCPSRAASVHLTSPCYQHIPKQPPPPRRCGEIDSCGTQCKRKVEGVSAHRNRGQSRVNRYHVSSVPGPAGFTPPGGVGATLPVWAHCTGHAMVRRGASTTGCPGDRCDRCTPDVAPMMMTRWSEAIAVERTNIIRDRATWQG